MIKTIIPPNLMEFIKLFTENVLGMDATDIEVYTNGLYGFLTIGGDILLYHPETQKFTELDGESIDITKLTRIGYTHMFIIDGVPGVWNIESSLHAPPVITHPGEWDTETQVKES